MKIRPQGIFKVLTKVYPILIMYIYTINSLIWSRWGKKNQALSDLKDFVFFQDKFVDFFTIINDARDHSLKWK